MCSNCISSSCVCSDGRDREASARRAHVTFISELIAAHAEIQCLRNQLDAANEEVRKLARLVYRSSHLF